MTIQEAKNTTVYYVKDNVVVESSYMEYLDDFGQGDDASSIEEEERISYEVDGSSFESEEEAEEYCNENELDYSLIEEVYTTYYTHVVRYHANYGRKIKSKGWESEDREVVEAEYIQGLEWYISEKNWDAPEYFSTSELAEASRIERAAEAMRVDVEVYLSIERKAILVAEKRKKLAQEISDRFYAEQAVVFEKYKNLISKIEGESYKETEQRLSKALGEKINGSTFHKIIKAVRQ